MKAVEFIRRNWLCNENLDSEHAIYYALLIPHLFYEEMKFIVLRALVDSDRNLDKDMKEMLDSYSFTDAINARIADDKRFCLAQAKEDYRNHIIRKPDSRWGYDLFQHYYDGWVVPDGDGFNSEKWKVRATEAQLQRYLKENAGNERKKEEASELKY